MLRVAVLIALVTSLVALAAGPVPAGTKKPPKVRYSPATIPSDCSVDVTDALRRWIESVPNKAVARFPADACYRIDGTLPIRNRKHFTLDGNSATLQAVTEGLQSRRHLVIVGGRDITVKDLTVRGSNPTAGAVPAAYVPSKAFQHGFSVNSAKDVRLERVEAYAVRGDFVYIGSDGPTGPWSDGVTVVDSKFQGSGRQGISITAGRNVVIERNEIAGVPLSLIDLEANTLEGGAVNVRIIDNVTGAARHFWLANKGSGYNINNIEVTGNRMTAPTGNLVFVYGPRGGYRGPFTITGNTMITNASVHDEGSVGAFFFSQSANVTVANNTVGFPADRHVVAVQAQDSEYVKIEGNIFQNADRELLTNTRAPVAGG